MNKTKYLTLRVTENELASIKEKSAADKLSVSEWVLKCLLEDLREKTNKNPIRREIEKITNEVIEETRDHLEKLKKSSVDNIMLDAEILLDSENKKCRSSNCQSFNTKKYQRSTGDFWLCDTHKP